MKAAILNSGILDSTILHKKLHLFILTQLDDGSHLEFCHVGFSHFAQTSDSNSFIFTHLDDGSHLELCHLGFNHFAQNKLHSFNLTQLDDGSHLEFCHLEFRHPFCTKLWLIFSQIHLKTLSLLSDSGSLAVIFNLAILDSTILAIPLILTHTCQDWFPPFAQKKNYSHSPPYHLDKKTSLIHSDSTWWWQPSWILSSWILPSLIQSFCTKLWLKLIQSDSNSYILNQLDDDSHLGFSHFAQNKLHSFIVTQLEDGSHL